MVSGRNPWYVASPKTDEGFRLFLREGPAWLQANLPISAGAAALLGRIFELDPARRIALPELRAAVDALDTFFPPAAPAHASTPSSFPSSSAVSVTIKAASASPLTDRRTNVPDSAWGLALALPSALSTRFLSFSAGALAAAATATLVNGSGDTSTASHFSDALDDVWSVTAPRPVPATPESMSASGTGEGGGGSGSSSGEESLGPETPETFAADVGVAAPAVPELALDAHANAPAPEEGVDVNAAVAAVKAEEVRTKRRRGSFKKGLMNGMRRIRIRTHA